MAFDFLEELQRSHRDDKDAGEGLVEHIRRIIGGLPSTERQELEEKLARLAADESNDLSGVALEVFAREGQSKAEVIFLIFRTTRNSRWRDQVALALARMRARQFAVPLKQHISRVLDDAHSSGPTELAYLHSIDADGFLDLAVPYVVRVLTQSDERSLTGLVPLYTNELSGADGAPLMTFLERLCAEDANAARRFAGMVTDYLSRPWSQESLGRTMAGILKRRLEEWNCR